MRRRLFLQSVGLFLAASRVHAAAAVSTLIGTGTAGLSDREVNDPFGIIFGPDGGLFFCDLGNQLVRRLDLRTGRTTIVAGNGQMGYSGDRGLATHASLNMPHEIQFDVRGNLYIAERDNHVVRKVEAKTGIISTFAGTGVAGFSGDGGPGAGAQLRQPHSIVVDRSNHLLICDIGNQRIRRVDLATGIISTYGGTGVSQPPVDGAPVNGTPLNGPRTMVCDDAGDLYLALREGNTIFRIAAKSQTLHHIAGTGKQGYSGDGGPARAAELAGPKGLAYGPRGALYVADTENHVIRKIDTAAGVISTVLGNGTRGDGPEDSPQQCRMSRPHGLVVDADGVLYVTDSEAHRIRILK